MDSTDNACGGGGGSKSIHQMETPELFIHFVEKAFDVQPITDAFNLLKAKLGLEDKYGRELYNGLKSNLSTWKAKSLWEILDKKVYIFAACHFLLEIDYNKQECEFVSFLDVIYIHPLCVYMQTHD